MHGYEFNKMSRGIEFDKLGRDCESISTSPP